MQAELNGNMLCSIKTNVSFALLFLQGEAVLFITTNFITTPEQKLGYCAEVRYEQN